jgi:hypothetical protein
MAFLQLRQGDLNLPNAWKAMLQQLHHLLDEPHVI